MPYQLLYRMVPTMFSKTLSVHNSGRLRQGSERSYIAYGLLAACTLNPQPAFVQSNEQGAESIEIESVTLNEITLADQLSWSVLKIVAPERLQEIVPVYIYTDEETRDVTTTHAIPCLELAFQDPDAGTICVYGEVRSEEGQDHMLNFAEYGSPSSGDGDLALNHRVPDTPPDHILWMTRGAWSHAVQTKEENLDEQNLLRHQ